MRHGYSPNKLFLSVNEMKKANKRVVIGQKPKNSQPPATGIAKAATASLFRRLYRRREGVNLYVSHELYVLAPTQGGKLVRSDPW